MPAAPRRALARLAAGPALAGLLLLTTAPGAAAHDELVRSDPATGAALDAAPAEVRLDYSADVLTFGAAVVVADTAGTAWQVGEPVMDGPSVTVPLDPALPDGAYEIRWRVVSSDGHPITGRVPFTVGDVSPAVPGGTADGGGSDGTGAATSDGSAPDGAVPDGAGSDGAALAEPSSASAPWRTAAVAGGGAVLALGLYLLVAALRRRRATAA